MSLYIYDRFIDVDELMGVMVMLGNPRSEDEVRIMIAEEDKNGDGFIEWEEITPEYFPAPPVTFRHDKDNNDNE